MTWSFVKQDDPQTSAPVATLAPDVADEFVESYLSWRDESVAVQSAYECWRAAESHDAALAYSAYCAALDLEECAAKVFRAAAGRISAVGEL